MPKVSVIVPVYNVEKYIRKCLDSLIEQSLDSIQIIIVNDGSKDHCDEIIENYRAKYSDKIISLKKENGGLSSARNYGIPYATGEYIAFLDSDDYVEENMYETMYKKAKQGDFDMVECNFFWDYPNKHKKDIGLEYKTSKEALEKARVVAWNKLYKREIIQNSSIRFPEGLLYEDVEFFYKILPSLKKIGFVKEPFVHYIQRKNSISNTQTERTGEIFTILDNVMEFYKKQGLWEEHKIELEYTYTRYLLCSSLKRIAKIKDEQTRKKLLDETWQRLNTKFPHWKENTILNKSGKKNLYMKSINHTTFKIYCRLFSKF